MIKTPLTQFESELIEIEDLFKGAKDLKITHLFTETENKVVNTFTFSGKSYAFGNFIKNGKHNYGNDQSTTRIFISTSN